MPKLKSTHIFVTAAQDAAITAAAMSDPDAIPFSDSEWDKLKPLMRLGRPKAQVVSHDQVLIEMRALLQIVSKT